MKTPASEIRVKRIRVNQGLGVHYFNVGIYACRNVCVKDGRNKDWTKSKRYDVYECALRVIYLINPKV